MTLEPRLSLASWDDAERLFRSRREALVPIGQPLVLVSQLQRCGGTLLNTLLDGHPELHVHPYEVLIGHPSKYDWPELDLAGGADAWLDVLREPRVARLFEEGYSKVGGNEALREAEPLPFTVVPSLLEALFRVLCEEREPATARAVLDTYFTAFFNAWLDCTELRREPKRWVAGFGPRLAWGESRPRFFADYPDGRLIAILRDPRGWYASASVFSARYGERESALELWRQGANEIAAAKAEAPDRVLVLSYEALVRAPEPTMRAVAHWLDIAWHPGLLVPTFNRIPTVANSSYSIGEAGIHADLADRWRTTLAAEDVALVEEALLPLHEEVSSLVDVSG